MSTNETIRMKANATGWKVLTTILVIVIIIMAIILINNYIENDTIKKQNVAYSATSVELYAGPDKSYACEEEISGYFEYQTEEDGWLILERKNSEGEPVVRWVNTKDLTSWGQYCYSSNSTKVAKSTTEK